MSMKISDGSSSVVIQPFSEDGPPILHIDDGTDTSCPRSPDLDGVPTGANPQVGLPGPPVDPSPKGPMPDPGGGDIVLLAALRA